MNHNKNYETALKYVEKTYPWLFGNHIESITLINPDHTNSAWYGLHQYSSTTERSTILIRNGRYDVIQFIDTIVHELVHAMQSRTDMITSEWCKANKHELHADGLAYQVVKKYKEENNIPLWR